MPSDTGGNRHEATGHLNRGTAAASHVSPAPLSRRPWPFSSRAGSMNLRKENKFNTVVQYRLVAPKRGCSFMLSQVKISLEVAEGLAECGNTRRADRGD